VAGAAIASRAASRPSLPRRSVVGLPSSRSAAVDYGAIIKPVDATRGAGLLGSLGLRNPRTGGADVLSVLGLPDFLRDAGARERRPDSGVGNVQGVLGQQATSGGLGNGGLGSEDLPLFAFGLLAVSSLLLLAAVVPAGVVARTPISPVSFARVRQPLALTAIAILLPLAFVALSGAL
jgi:hypothetical protein